MGLANVLSRISTRVGIGEFLSRTPHQENKESLEWRIADSYPRVAKVAAALVAGGAYGLMRLAIPNGFSPDLDALIAPAIQQLPVALLIYEGVRRRAAQSLIGHALGLNTHMPDEHTTEKKQGATVPTPAPRFSLRTYLAWYPFVTAGTFAIHQAMDGFPGIAPTPENIARYVFGGAILTPVVRHIGTMVKHLPWKDVAQDLRNDLWSPLRQAYDRFRGRSRPKSQYVEEQYARKPDFAHAHSLLDAYLTEGRQSEALTLLDTRKDISNSWRAIPLRPGTVSMNLVCKQAQRVRNSPNDLEGYQTLGFVLAGFGRTPLARAALQSAQPLLTGADEAAAEKHVVHARLSRLARDEPAAQEHLAHAAEIVSRTPLFEHLASIGGHPVYLLQNKTFGKVFAFKAGPRHELEEERRMTLEAEKEEHERLLIVNHLCIPETPRGPMGVLEYEDKPTVAARLFDRYDLKLHEEMLRNVGYLAARFSPDGLVPQPILPYTLSLLPAALRHLAQERHGGPSLDEEIEALSLFARSLAGSPLVTYLDSHPEQYLLVRESPWIVQERLDIQNKGLRELSAELGKGIERSPLGGIGSNEAKLLREKLLCAGVESYNQHAAHTVDIDAMRHAKRASDILLGISFVAKYDPVRDSGQQENLRLTMQAGLVSFHELLHEAGVFYDAHERKALEGVRDRVYRPLCEKFI